MGIIIDEAATLSLIALLDRLGFGASKRTAFFLPDINIEQTKVLLGHFCAKYGWRLIKEEKSEEALIIIFQVGQWGLSISGSQNVYLALKQEGTGVRGAATSKSTMSQLIDWGKNQKNLNNLLAFFDQIKAQPDQLENLLVQPPSFVPAKSTINPKFFWILGFIFLFALVFQIFISPFIAEYLSKSDLIYDNLQDKVGGDTDEHGCKGSAGYSWCEAKNKCLRIWEESCTEKISETANWQTYQNEKYGFGVKYPNFYYSKEDSLRKVWFFHQKSTELSLPGASIEVLEKNINSVIQELKNQDPGITQVIEEKDITINNQSAKKLILTTAIGLDEIYYVLSKNNLTFLLSYREGIKDQLDILSTFKFIEPIVNVSNLQTYQNEKYGFEIKYPGAWFIETNDSLTEITPLSPNDPKRASSVGIASTFSVSVHNKTLQGILTEYEKYNLRDFAKSEAIIAENIKATKLTYKGEYANEKHIVFLISRPDYVLKMRYIDDTIYQAGFEKILSTFKFIK